MKQLQTLLIFIVFFTVSTSSHALRCGSNLILEGDEMYTVTKKCGEPDAKYDYREYHNKGYSLGGIERRGREAQDDVRLGDALRIRRDMTEERNVSVWTYDMKKARGVIYFLRFENDKLDSIRSRRR